MSTTDARIARLRNELADGVGNAPPDWYLLKLISDQDERAELPLPSAPVVNVSNGIRPRHVGHWLEWIRTLVPCAVLCVQLLILYRQ